MWSSWSFGRVPSKRCLVDSWASYDACMLWFSDFVVFSLQEHSGFHSNFHFSLRLWWFLWTLSSGSMTRCLSTFRALSSFGLSIAPCCFSFRWAAFDTLDPNFGPQVIRSDSCLKFCKPPARTTCILLEVFHCELRGTSPRTRQVPIAINVPIIIDSAFLQHRPRLHLFFWSRQYVWCWEWLFLRHMKLHSWSTWWRKMQFPLINQKLFRASLFVTVLPVRVATR